MISAGFEWDDAKAAANWRRHGVAVEHTVAAIRGTSAIGWIEDRQDHGEGWINLLGMCEGTLLHVAFTERGERIRIISARRAVRHEQDRYFKENSG